MRAYILFQLHSASLRFIQILPIARLIKQKTPISCMKSAFSRSVRGSFFEQIMAIFELIEPIVNSKIQIVSNAVSPQIKNKSKSLKTKRNVRKR
jgi:hypothetical protein